MNQTRDQHGADRIEWVEGPACSRWLTWSIALAALLVVTALVIVAAAVFVSSAGAAGGCGGG
ncbi:MAG: hypothetical protein ACLQRH_23405 [Acidimicrobiales bacterium]